MTYARLLRKYIKTQIKGIWLYATLLISTQEAWQSQFATGEGTNERSSESKVR